MATNKKKRLETPLGRAAGKERPLLADAETVGEMRSELTEAVRTIRLKAGLTQAELAKAMGSSQSRVAKMETGNPQASLELLVRALVAAGGQPRVEVIWPNGATEAPG